MASLALPSARPWRAMGMRDRPAGCASCASACAALCAVGGRRAGADVDRLLVAIFLVATVDAGRRGSAPCAGDDGPPRGSVRPTRHSRHTATSLMLLLLLRPPAAPRGSATGCSPKHGAERSAVKGPR